MTATEAFDAIKAKFINTDKKVVTRECSTCNYPLGYVWKDGVCAFDSGCHCTYMRGGFQRCPDDELLKTLRMNEGNQKFFDRLLNQEGIDIQ